MSATSVDQAVTFRAMATKVCLRIIDPTVHAVEALDRAEAVFKRVEEACTRFQATSPLMQANADPSRWHEVPIECARAICPTWRQ